MSRSLRAIVVAATALTTGLAGTALLGAPARAADATSPLSIAAGRYVGGAGSEEPVDTAIGPDGSVYVLANLDGADFPLDPGGHKGNGDVLVLRLSSDLQTVAWAKTIGGTGQEFARALEVDDNSVLVAGLTGSADFPTTAGTLKPAGNGSTDGFVTRLSADTGAVVWSTRIGGTSFEDLLGIDVGPDGRIWLAGWTYGMGFPTTADGNAVQADGADAFLTALNSTGTAVSYSTKLGAALSDKLIDVTVGPHGKLYALGKVGTWSPGSPTSSLGADDPGDLAVLRFAMSGTKPVLEHASYVGGEGGEHDPKFVVDGKGAVIVTGTVTEPGLPLVNPIQDTFAMPGMAGFVAKISPSGTSLEWSTYFGEGEYVTPARVAVDTRGDVYVAGEAFEAFPLERPLQASFAGGDADAYLAKITTDGRLAYSTYLGSTEDDDAGALALDASGAPVVAIRDYGTERQLPAGSADTTNAGGWDTVVLRVETTVTISGLTGPTGATADRTPTWTFGTNLRGAHTECRIDAGAWTACSPGNPEATSYTAGALADGRHTFQVRALDRPGHVGPVTSLPVTIDTTANTRIAKRPKKVTTKAKARFTFRAEPGATFSCKLDKRAWKKCGSRYVVKVKPGKHRLQVRATDKLGNTDPTPATFRWKRR